MDNQPNYFTAVILVGVLLYGCVDKTSVHKTRVTWPITRFDLPGKPQEYLPFRHERVKSWEDYGIYSDQAEASLKRVAVGGKHSALEIHFEIPPLSARANWLSIRKEFDSIADLSSYEGLELKIESAQAKNTLLRLTLCDVDEQESFRLHGADEMWWFDMPKSIFDQRKLITAKAPFKNFEPAYGEGARRRDGRLDLSKIVAYEINLMTSGTASGNGLLRLYSIRAYGSR
jgi:hypothetical protein